MRTGDTISLLITVKQKKWLLKLDAGGKPQGPATPITGAQLTALKPTRAFPTPPFKMTVGK